MSPPSLLTFEAGAPNGPVELRLHYELEQFLYHEAQLLDERRFDEWVQLFAPDVHYWMPARTTRMPREAAAEIEDLYGAAHFDDDLAHLQLRIRKLATDRSWSEAPPSRTRHLITNVRAGTTRMDREYLVRSNFLLYRSRHDRYEDQFAGERSDLIRRVDDDRFLIARRHILLDQSVVLANNLSVFF